MNCYPQEYLEKWEIIEQIVELKEEAQQLKQHLKNQGFTVSSKTISFVDLARCSIIQIIGLKDKTQTKTPEEIKKELKTLF